MRMAESSQHTVAAGMVTCHGASKAQARRLAHDTLLPTGAACACAIMDAGPVHEVMLEQVGRHVGMHGALTIPALSSMQDEHHVLALLLQGPCAAAGRRRSYRCCSASSAHLHFIHGLVPTLCIAAALSGML